MTGRQAFGRYAVIGAACALLALGAEAATAGAATVSASTTSPRVGPTGGDQVTFTGTTSLVSPTGLTWTWSFGDGSGTTTTTGTAKHTYTKTGPFTVSVSVSDGVNPADTGSTSVTAVVDKPPAASFTFSPAAPIIGQLIHFHSTSTDPDGPIASLAWDLDNNGVFNDGTAANVTKAFPDAGPHTVTLQVTDDLGATNTTSTSVVVNTPPTASFTFSPQKPIEGDTVTFTSTSSDVDGTIVSTKWDLNGDGAYNDASGPTATKQFTVPGTDTVGVRVTDDRGAVTTATGTVTVVANQPPVATFTFSPAAPSAGDAVTLSSTAKDADGKVVKQEWDLNGDGVYDDATGATVKHTFDAGPHRVGLRVTDDRGATDVASQTINVAAKPTTAPSGNSFTSPGPTAVPKPGPSMLSPFPIVSLRGRLVRGGAFIDALEILQAPHGTRVEVRCRGRGCPFHRKVHTARTARNVRFRELQRRLRAGTLIQVFITKPGLIGKYTSFRIRSGATPLRRDRCLLPGARRPTRCSPA